MVKILIFLILSLNVRANDDTALKSFCDTHNGTLSEEWTCPSTNEKRTGLFCTIKNNQKNDLVTNGCTGATGPIADLLLPACVLHDFCYHHEPQFSGKTKKDCDRRLLLDSYKICDRLESQNSGFRQNGDGLLSKEYCRASALLFYRGVRVGGNKSWQCSKKSAAYPDSFYLLNHLNIK